MKRQRLLLGAIFIIFSCAVLALTLGRSRPKPSQIHFVDSSECQQGRQVTAGPSPRGDQLSIQQKLERAVGDGQGFALSAGEERTVVAPGSHPEGMRIIERIIGDFRGAPIREVVEQNRALEDAVLQTALSATRDPVERAALELARANAQMARATADNDPLGMEAARQAILFG